MRFSVLGPLEVHRDEIKVPLGGPRQRALLAILLLHANEVVSRDRLVEGMWSEQPPQSAEHTLDTYVSRLRKLLGHDRLERRPPGYTLRVAPDELDLDRFDDALKRGRETLASGDARGAATILREALALWRGPVLADLQFEPFAQQAVEQLEEKRVAALEERFEAELAAGAGAELVTELERLVSEHPFRERLLAQLMLALYRAGRQAEALAALQAGRRRLAEDLGLAPGPALRQLEADILAHDAGLLPHNAGARARPRRRPAPAVVGALLVIAAVVGTVAVAVRDQPRERSAGTVRDAVDPHAVAVSADRGRTSRTVRLPGPPAAVAAGHGSLWFALPAQSEVVRVDPAGGGVSDRVPTGEAPDMVAVSGESVWTARVADDTVLRIDPRTGTIAQRVRLGSASVGALAVQGRKLWVADRAERALLEVDEASAGVARRIPLEAAPTTIAARDDQLWIADYDGNAVAQIDTRSGRTVATVQVGNGPSDIALDGDALWVANALDSTVSKVSLASHSVVATIPVGSGPSAIAVGAGAVWVASEHGAAVQRIDPAQARVRGTERVGGAPAAIVAHAGAVWAAIRPVVARRGGTLRLLNTRPFRPDPALQVDLLPLQADRLVHSGLVAYNHVAGAAGTRLVPDLAVSIPRPAFGGTAYTFRLRPGVRYSDGRPLRATDFRRAIERVLTMRSEATPAFANLRGAQACLRVTVERCDLSTGIVADDALSSVTFRLRRPDPDFLTSLALNSTAAPVPPGTPFRDAGFDPVPGTGPYKIAAADEREIRYVRNAHFHERSHAAQPDGNPDEIVMRFGLSPQEQIHEIELGRADWAADSPASELLPRLRARYPGRLHRWAIPTTDFFQFNTSLPPFDDVRVRRALNFAIDRRKIVDLYGGADLASPTCQVLPPGIPGHRRRCPYTRAPNPAGRWRGPDVARARRLVAASGTRGQRVKVWGFTDHPAISPEVVRYVAGVLRRLGYRAQVKLVPEARLQAPLSAIQLIPGAWGNDTPDAMLSLWFSCDGPNVHGWFCDRWVDRQLTRARSSAATDPRAARSMWAAIDRRLVDRAAWLPMVNEGGIDFVSARLRNYQFNPYWGFVADQVWLAPP